MKKIFLTVTVFAVVIFLSIGCVTKEVWTERLQPKPYDETILSFYTDSQKSNIVFIGEKYHYIFDENTEDFAKVLRAKELLKLSKDKLTIHASVDQENQKIIYANIIIRLPLDKLTKEQSSWMESNLPNIEQIPPLNIEGKHPPKALEYRHLFFNIKGKRYTANPEINSKVVKLKSPLKIEITEFEMEKKNPLYKIAMTPLSLTADAGLIIIGAGVAIVIAPFALVSTAYDAITE